VYSWKETSLETKELVALRERKHGGVDWNELALLRIKGQHLVNTPVHTGVPEM
jgi:hypothetical protein